MKTTTKGIDSTEALQLMFIYLKLTEVIDWSWWFIMMPTIAVIGIVGLTIIVKIISEVKKEKKNEKS